MDEADRTFKWVCGKCGECLEESDLGMLEVRQQTHRCKVNKVVIPKSRKVKSDTCGIIE